MRSYILVISLISYSYAFGQGVSWPEALTAHISEAVCLKSFPNSEFLSLPLDGEAKENGAFNLFYFSNQTIDPTRETILYVDGGPGQVARASVNTLRFLDQLDKNIVYFHPRAAGCSHFPLDNSFDRYIRTRYIIQDLEALRAHLGVKQWDILFGVSAGTNVGLSFAEAFPASVGQLVLEGLHNPGAQAESSFFQAIKKGFPTFLNMIIFWPEFNGLSEDKKRHIINQYNHIVEEGDLSLKHFNDTLINTEDLQRLMGLLFQLSYYGVEQENDFNKSLAISTILQILPFFLDKADVNSIARPTLNAANNFELLSRRAFLTLMSHDGLHNQFVTFLQQTTIEESIIELAGPLAPYMSIGSDLMTETMPRPAVPSNIPMTIFQGEVDGGTPLELALPMLIDSGYQYQLYALPGYGHSRHFSEACYDIVFNRLLAKTEIESVFQTFGGPCFLKAGYKKYE